MNSIDNFLALIRPRLTPSQISTDPDQLAFYGQDWSNVLTVDASAVLFPKTTEEVALILAAASQHSIAIVPSGGRTGLSGGAVAQNGEVILSLEKLNFIGPLNETALSLHVGAGAITQAVHEFCEPAGLTWPVDFASKGSSCVGGNLATNAGGVRVLRYGNTRNWVLNITAVTMDGSTHSFNGELEKNNTGYDLRQLMIGSEGTLAVITEATLKLAPLPRSKLVFFFSLDGFSSVISLFAHARKNLPNLSAFECFDQACLESVLSHFKKPAPIQTLGPAFVLMEIENTDFEAAESFLADLFERGLVLDGVMAQNDREAANLWHYREGIAESILSGNTVHQEDVSVPIAKLEEFYAEIHARYQQSLQGYGIFFFGHIGDGNLHIFVTPPKKTEATHAEFLAQMKKMDLALFEVLAQYHGSVSAEHGIGVLKRHAIHFSRTPQELTLLRGIKAAFDPQGLLNPGKLI